MIKRMLIASVFTVGLGAAGVAQAQPTSPTTSPPDRMTGSSTMNNPATATTPPAGSPAALASPGTAATPTSPALGTPGDTSTGSSAHSTATPGAPANGANSFTEGEARSRIQDRGFTQVSDLKLDTQGIWRGKATKDGKNVGVALDYKGEVIEQ